MTATFFWRIFEETGSINAYLAYKQFNLIKKKNKQKNYI
ncbi:YqzL family protein [Halothermothrix orenii]